MNSGKCNPSLKCRALCWNAAVCRAPADQNCDHMRHLEWTTHPLYSGSLASKPWFMPCSYLENNNTSMLRDQANFARHFLGVNTKQHKASVQLHCITVVTTKVHNIQKCDRLFRRRYCMLGPQQISFRFRRFHRQILTVDCKISTTVIGEFFCLRLGFRTRTHWNLKTCTSVPVNGEELFFNVDSIPFCWTSAWALTLFSWKCKRTGTKRTQRLIPKFRRLIGQNSQSWPTVSRCL